LVCEGNDASDDPQGETNDPLCPQAKMSRGISQCNDVHTEYCSPLYRISRRMHCGDTDFLENDPRDDERELDPRLLFERLWFI